MDDEASSTDSEGLYDKNYEDILNEDTGPFSLETNIENVVKLQNVLQAERHKFHKEQRARIFLENIKTSLETDNCNFQKKIDVLSKEKLELEKCKIELELKIKQLQLLLTEEKGKRMNVEEHLRLLKEQVFKGGETYDVESSKIRIMNSTQDSKENPQIIELENLLREQEMTFKEKELQWTLDQQKYQQEVMKIRSEFNNEKCADEECKEKLKSELQQLQSELRRQEKLFYDEKMERDNLSTILKTKEQQIQKLMEQESLQARKLDNMIPKTVVEDLKKDKNSLLRKLQEKENMFESLKEERDLINSQLMVTSRSVEDRNDELNELMRKFNMERETSSRLKEENMKLKMDNLSLKSSEERSQQKLKIYEELHKNKESKSTDFDAKIEEMKKLNDLLDAQSRQQNLNLQREKIELQGKFELLENEMREAKMHLSIVNEQLKMSEENCARFLKDLQISEQRNMVMSRENDKLQRQVKELTEDTHKSKTSEDQFKNLMHSMKHFQARTIEMGLENVMNILKTNNAKLKTVLTQSEREHLESLSIKVEDHQLQDDSARSRRKVSHKSRKQYKAVKDVNLQSMQESIEAHYQLQLSQKLTKLNEYLKKHALENHILEDFVLP